MIGDKAKAADKPDIFLGHDLSGIWQLESMEPVDCDNLTDEGEFPEFGDFVKVKRVDRDGNTSDEPAYLSRYVDLDGQLANVIDEVGDVFTISRVMEKRDGGYTMDVEAGMP